MLRDLTEDSQDAFKIEMRLDLPPLVSSVLVLVIFLAPSVNSVYFDLPSEPFLPSQEPHLLPSLWKKSQKKIPIEIWFEDLAIAENKTKTKLTLA